MRKDHAFLVLALAIAGQPLAAQAISRDSVVYELLPTSRLEVRTGKAGLLGFAGHEHLIRANRFSGRVVFYPDQPAASHITVSVATDGLEVLTPPDTEEIRKVTAAMRDEVLDVARHPEITLTGRTLDRAGDTLRLQATLAIKGQTRELPLVVRVDIGADTLRASTSFDVKQSDFGIRPYRGGPGGTVRVADRVTFAIDAIALRVATPH